MLRFFLFATLLHAGQIPEKPAGFVTDSAKVLSASEIRHLSTRCVRLDKAGKAEVAIVLLAIQDRKSRIEVGSGMEHLIPDEAAKSILAAMRPALREGNTARPST